MRRAKPTQRYPLTCTALAPRSNLYGYQGCVSLSCLVEDIRILIERAKTAPARRLVVVGGLASYKHTGQLTGKKKEKDTRCSRVSFSKLTAKLPPIDYIYAHLGRYTLKGKRVKHEQEQALVAQIERYLQQRHIVLLAWGYSWVWATDQSLIYPVDLPLNSQERIYAVGKAVVGVLGEAVQLASYEAFVAGQQFYITRELEINLQRPGFQAELEGQVDKMRLLAAIFAALGSNQT